MISRLSTEVKVGAALLDGLIVGVALFVASVIRFPDTWLEYWDFLVPAWRLLLAGYATLTVGTFWLTGLYRFEQSRPPARLARDVLRSLIVVIIGTLSLLYLLKLQDVSRILLAVFFTILAVGVFLTHLAVSTWFRRLRARGVGTSKLLIVGSGPAAKEFVDLLRVHPEQGLKPVGFITQGFGSIDDLPHLGEFSEIEEVLTEHVIDEVAVCLPAAEWRNIEGISRICQEQGKAVRIPVGALDQFLAQGRVETIDGHAFVSLSNGPDHAVALAIKRAVDVAGSTAALLLLSPILLAAALVSLAVEGRPLFFHQLRGGLNGRPFHMVKFRTMSTDAEERKDELMSQNLRVGPAFKLAEDPRVTPMGRFLRRWSIDEIPQLWNVLKGDMSLVGPRPQPMSEVRAYDLWHRRRLSVRPGITGLWQVTARGEPDFDTWVELDLAYIDNWSLVLDLEILAKTPLAVIRSPGE